MNIYINGLSIEYEVSGSGTNVLLLHGWGMNHLTFDRLTKYLSSMYCIYSIDLPGFGKSDIIDPLSVEEVCDIVYKFTSELNIVNPIILGHSYGGRIGILYASKYTTLGLVLVSTPGIRKKLTLNKKIKIMLYKLAKKIKLDLNFGSSDYLNANDIMKKTLVKTINYDLIDSMKKIKCPTLIIGGSKDIDVLPKQLYEMKKYIQFSEVVLIEDVGHFPYLQRPIFFNLIIESFLKEFS